MRWLGSLRSKDRSLRQLLPRSGRRLDLGRFFHSTVFEIVVCPSVSIQNGLSRYFVPWQPRERSQRDSTMSVDCHCLTIGFTDETNDATPVPYQENHCHNSHVPVSLWLCRGGGYNAGTGKRTHSLDLSENRWRPDHAGVVWRNVMGGDCTCSLEVTRLQASRGAVFNIVLLCLRSTDGLGTYLSWL